MLNKRVLIVLILLVVTGIVSGTYAYFTSTATLNNEFKTGIYATSVTEEFESPDNWTPGQTTTKKVNVTNNGTVNVAARAIYTESWTATDGTVLSGTRDGEKVAQFTVGSDWELAQDGYYYYKDILSTDDVSTDFISSVTFNPNFELEEGTDIECTTEEVDGKTTVSCKSLESGYDGATYRLDITIETIQADQRWKYTEAYGIGKEVTIGNETFYVVSDNGDTVTVLAQYNLGTDYRQSSIENKQTFANEGYWTEESLIDIQNFDGQVKTYVNEYESYLQTLTSDNSISVNLLTVADLESLGCKQEFPSYTCSESPNVSWLNKGQAYWTRKASDIEFAWFVEVDKRLYAEHYSSARAGIRPVITISKDTLSNF